MPVVPCKVTALAPIVNGGSQEGETAWRLFALHHEPTSLTRAWKLKLVVNSSSSIEMWTGTRKRVKRGFPNHIRFAWEWHAGWSLESAFGVEQRTTHDLESVESSHRHCQTCTGSSKQLPATRGPVIERTRSISERRVQVKGKGKGNGDIPKTPCPICNTRDCCCSTNDATRGKGKCKGKDGNIQNMLTRPLQCWNCNNTGQVAKDCATKKPNLSAMDGRADDRVCQPAKWSGF